MPATDHPPSHPSLTLPEVKLFRQCGTKFNAWSDHYGALHTAAAHAGVPLSSSYVINAVWQHGCHGPWMNFAPGVLCSSVPNADKIPLFVARQDQVDYLRSHGCQQVRAIGLPIVYAAPAAVARIPRSLLVVPTHTLIGDSFPDRTHFEEYASEIAAIAAHFARVTVCVHPNCRKNGLWVNEFARRGFEIVYGAQTNDAYALGRMCTLFSQFENVTTNGWGSHVAYALANGARLSIYGTQPQRSEADYLRDIAWSANPEALKLALSSETAAKERAYLTAYYRSPIDAVGNIEQGRWLIGADNRISREEMREVLNVMVTSQPAAESSVAGRQEQIRGQATELAKSGRTVEAAQLLLRYLQAVVESKQPRLILDTLTFVAQDLESLDPAKAAVVREQAKKLSARLANAA